MRIPTTAQLNQNTKPIYGSKLKIKLTKDIVYTFGKMCIVVPKGYVSDGTTTPWFIRAFIDRFDERFLAGAILHDYLLDTDFLDRPIADEYFFSVLKRTAPLYLSIIYYIGVKIGTLRAFILRDVKHKKYPGAKEKANQLSKNI